MCFEDFIVGVVASSLLMHLLFSSMPRILSYTFLTLRHSNRDIVSIESLMMLSILGQVGSMVVESLVGSSMGMYTSTSTCYHHPHQGLNQ